MKARLQCAMQEFHHDIVPRRNRGKGNAIGVVVPCKVLRPGDQSGDRWNLKATACRLKFTTKSHCYR